MDRDEKLNARDWECFRAMMASENGFALDQEGWRRGSNRDGRPLALLQTVPQVSSTLALQGGALHD